MSLERKFKEKFGTRTPTYEEILEILEILEFLRDEGAPMSQSLSPNDLDLLWDEPCVEPFHGGIWDPPSGGFHGGID